MRVFRIAFSLWWDPLWRQNFRRSWKVRRYWLAIPPRYVLDGRMIAVQLGPVTLRLLFQGRMEAHLG